MADDIRIIDGLRPVCDAVVLVLDDLETDSALRVLTAAVAAVLVSGGIEPGGEKFDSVLKQISAGITKQAGKMTASVAADLGQVH
jgi:hypothetical protein